MLGLINQTGTPKDKNTYSFWTRPALSVPDNPVHYSVSVLSPSILPWYAINGKDSTDSVYTKREVAKRCLNVFYETADKHGYNLTKHIFVEPSAGEGSFFDLLPNSRRFGLDINPRGNGILKDDFLKWSPSNSGYYAVVGNPPFGVRGALALAFINRAAHFADIVGFILPMTFASNGKGGAMTRVSGLSLLHSEDMESNSFHRPNGDNVDINTVFQVWSARQVAFLPAPPTCDDYVRIYTVCTSPSRRCGLTRMEQYDYFVQGTFYDNRPPKVVVDFADVKYGSGYGIVIIKNKNEVSAALKKADWNKYSSKATNHCRHIRIPQIRNMLTDAGFVDEK